MYSIFFKSVKWSKEIGIMMRCLYLFVLINFAAAQNGRVLRFPSYDNGHGWDIRLAVPGEPGNDYPTLANIPRTTFSCAGKDPGYYADVDTNCQVFRVCTVGATYGFQSFLCPNGTLFNQEVFVCDWWMNVNCRKSDEFIRNKNDQFENLKLGPQLMKDIKKMLTHPVRNPANTNAMKSKFIVMQNYKPPSGQLFPNEALLTPPERPPNLVYFPTKVIQTALRQNDYRAAPLVYSASTPSPHYIPPALNSFVPTTVRNVEILQRQQIKDDKSQNNYNPEPLPLQHETIISNGHTGQISTQMKYLNTKKPKYDEFSINQNTESANSFAGLKTQRNQQNTQQLHNYRQSFRSGNNGSPYNNKFMNTLNLTKQTQASLVTTNSPSVSLKNNQADVSKQVGSDIIPPTILSKTVAYSRLVQEPKEQSPKSRITFKTWVIKPSRKAKLIADPSPYTYDQPNNAQEITERSSFEAPYGYNKPIETFTEGNNLRNELNGYNYPNPVSVENSSKQQILPLDLIPITQQPILNDFLVTTTTPQPTIPSRFYLPLATANPSARQYLPPSEDSNRFVVTNSPQYQIGQLIAIPTSTSNDHSQQNLNEKTFNDYTYNNLTFSDILSRENLDITINEIVNDTNKVPQTASPVNSDLYFQNFKAQSTTNTLQDDDLQEESELPTTIPKPAKLIASPSRELEPPVYKLNSLSSNKISNLPYYKKNTLPTIERTVSLKITLPESIANLLFKAENNTKLEILNTDSSNYLVIKKMQDKNTSEQFLPIGKLHWSGNTNLSTSQALVFSLVADSINAAKKYNNIIQENIVKSPPSNTRQFKDVNSEELGRISNSISRLTATQYTKNGDKTNNYDSNTSQHNKSKFYPGTFDTKQMYTEQIQPKQTQSLSTEKYSYYKQNQIPLESLNSMPPKFSGQLYSGQLYKFPVPEVTRQITNSPNPATANIVIQSDYDQVKSQRNFNSKNNSRKTINSSENLKSKVEVFNRPNFSNSKLQVEPYSKQVETNVRDHDFSLNDFLNSGSEITAHLQDKISGTVLHPSETNKFITYKKDQSYYLQSKLSDKAVPILQKTKENKEETQNNNYPDIITFHYTPERKKHNNLELSQEKIIHKYRLTANSNSNELNADSDISSKNRYDDVTYSSLFSEGVSSQSNKYNERINRLYDGPSSYSAPQSSIGNLRAEQSIQDDVAKIEDLDENNNFEGYPKERPLRQFNF